MAYEIKQVKVVLLINICVYQLKKPNLTIWYRRNNCHSVSTLVNGIFRRKY